MCKKVPEQHGGAVQTVIFSSYNVRGTDAVPVKGAVQNRFKEVPVGEVIRPLALALEAGYDGVMAAGLFLEAQLR
ncbi:hypothetical protein D3C73_1508970 [compost metagenome]